MSTSIRDKLRHLLLIWLDTKLFTSEHHPKTRELFLGIVDSIEIFSDPDTCVDFLTDRDNNKERISLVLSESFGENIVPLIHEIAQLHSIYVYDTDESKKISWIFAYKKVQNQVWNNFQSISDHLKSETTEQPKESVAISVVSSSEIAAGTRQDPSFMYSQLLNEILLKQSMIDSELFTRLEMINFCRTLYKNNDSELRIIDEFDQEFSDELAITWYTRECFLHKILNRALWTPEPDVLYRLRYFLRLLDQQIRSVAAEQPALTERMTVFRGQGMSTDDFNKLKNGIGGLLAFRSFLSTSLNRNVACEFAEPFKSSTDQTSIIFVMNIDSNIQDNSFIHIGTVNNVGESEQEILFNIGTVFRIDKIEKLSDNQWEVYLASSNDIDVKLAQYTEQMRKQIQSSHPLISLVKLVDYLGQYKVIEALEKIFNEFNVLYQLVGLMSEMKFALGSAYFSAGHLKNALTHLYEGLNVALEHMPSNDPTLSSTYNTIGSIYHRAGYHEASLTQHQLAIDCQLNAQNPDFDSLATYCMNIAKVYNALKKYNDALNYQKRALEYRQGNQNKNDSKLMEIYSALGQTCYEMKDYEGAGLCSQQYYFILATYNGKALQIQETASATDPISSANQFLATGRISFSQGQYDDANQSFKCALDLQNQYLLPNNPLFADTHHLIAGSYYRKGKFKEAIPYYQKVLDYKLNFLPDDDPTLAVNYWNLSTAYSEDSQCERALECLYIGLKQLRKRSDPDPSELGQFMGQIGYILSKQKKYSEAMDYFKESLSLRQIAGDDENGSLEECYSRMGENYEKLENYSDALVCYGKKLDIEKNALIINCSTIATTYFNVSRMHLKISQYDEALQHAQKALEYLQKFPNQDIVLFSKTIFHLGNISHQKGKLSEAIYHYQQALPCLERCIDANDYQFANIYSTIARAYFETGNYSEALTYYENALQIEFLNLPDDEPTMATTYERLAETYTHLRRFDAAIDAYLRAIEQLSKTLPPDHADIQKLQTKIQNVLSC
ncbi:unnamed protein product [Rotaria sp. Silwood2]|nr:unnamed protein product [Rotaria sp. Silwood2]